MKLNAIASRTFWLMLGWLVVAMPVHAFYDPSLGRWLNRDPLGEGGGFNLYGFVGNGPVNFVDPFGLEVLLQTHPVAFGRNHSKITIIPQNQNLWKKHPSFTNRTSNVKCYVTIGAGSVGGYLESGLNRERDVNLEHNKFSSEVQPPGGMTEDQFIQALLNADSNFKGPLDYELLPQSRTDGYNSNSYINGLLESNGVTPTPPPSTPGFSKPVPPKHFK